MTETSTDDLRVVVTGDSIMTRRWSKCRKSQFQNIFNICEGSDVAFTNLELTLDNSDSFPASVGADTYLRMPDWVADELEWANFNLFSTATNHSSDYAYSGMLATMNALEQRNLTYAGLGRNLSSARSPAYIETGGGRVALISACSTFPPESVAGEKGPEMDGRPGINPLRLEPAFTVSEETLDDIRNLGALLGLEKAKKSRVLFRPDEYFADEDDEKYYFFNPGGGYLGSSIKFEVGEQSGFRWEAKDKDVEAIIRQIRVARRQANLVIVSIHSHEGVDGKINDSSVPDFLQTFARSCIDVGADIFIGHGPHVLRGIEIYQNSPIFYSLGNFIYQLETIGRFPVDQYKKVPYSFPENPSPSDFFGKRFKYETDSPTADLANDDYWRTILPVCEFSNGQLVGVKVHPVDLGQNEPLPIRGRPKIAKGETGEEIIAKVSELSHPFGTELVLENDTVRLEI